MPQEQKENGLGHRPDLKLLAADENPQGARDPDHSGGGGPVSAAGGPEKPHQVFQFCLLGRSVNPAFFFQGAGALAGEKEKSQ
jgi:hypothetical protein